MNNKLTDERIEKMTLETIDTISTHLVETTSEDGGSIEVNASLFLNLLREVQKCRKTELVGNEFIPKNLDKALGVVGVALPESKEEFNFQIERWIQLLIDRVIRYADEFKEQPVPVVPEE